MAKSIPKYSSSSDNEILAIHHLTGSDRKTTVKIPAKDISVEFAETMPLAAGVAARVELSSTDDTIEIMIGESPTYIVVTHK